MGPRNPTWKSTPLAEEAAAAAEVELARQTLMSRCPSRDSLEAEVALEAAAAEKEEVVACGGCCSGGGSGRGGWFRHWRTGEELNQYYEVNGGTCCVLLRMLALPLPIVSCTFFLLCTLTRSLLSLFLNNNNPFSSSSDRSSFFTLFEFGDFGTKSKRNAFKK